MPPYLYSGYSIGTHPSNLSSKFRTQVSQSVFSGGTNLFPKGKIYAIGHITPITAFVGLFEVIFHYK